MNNGKFLFNKMLGYEWFVSGSLYLFFRNKKKEYIKCLENRVAVLENQNKVTCNFRTFPLNMPCDLVTPRLDWYLWKIARIFVIMSTFRALLSGLANGSITFRMCTKSQKDGKITKT